MCEIGLCTSHHLGKVVACIFSPPPPHPMQVPITSILILEVTSHSGRGVFAHPISSHAAPFRAVSLITYQMGGVGKGVRWGVGYLRKKRCPAGDRPLSTSSVLLLHICQYTSTCHQGCHITSLYVSITLLLISKISTTCIFQFVCHSLFWFVIGLFVKKNFLLLRFVVFLDLSFLVKVQFYLFRVFFPTFHWKGLITGSTAHLPAIHAWWQLITQIILPILPLCTRKAVLVCSGWKKMC